MTDVITQEIDQNGIAWLTLNRPKCHNAINETIIQALTEATLACDNNDQVKMIVLKAAGKNFCSGADIEWMKKTAHLSEQENLQDALKLAHLLEVLSNCKKVTVAVIQGHVIGGGIGLLCCCDAVIAEQKAQFCFSEAKVGLVPATIAPYVIRAMGPRAAKYYFLTTQSFSAAQAKQLGLVHEVVAEGDLNAATIKLTSQLLKNGPNSLRLIKQLVAEISALENNFKDKTAALIAKVRVSTEAQEGLSAFLEKRAPLWIKSENEVEP